MRCEHHDPALLLPPQEVPRVPARGGVHARGRLVEEAYPRLAHEREGQAELPLHAPAEGLRLRTTLSR
eukprot:1954981-Pyramimonas_sp.AAC.1